MTKRKNNNNTLVNVGKYSGIAFQMIAIILTGVFGGQKLDEVLNKKSIFTALFTIISVIIAIYFAIKDFIKPSK